MEQKIINYLETLKYGNYEYIKITDSTTLGIIYQLLINNKSNLKETDVIKNPILCYYYDIYYYKYLSFKINDKIKNYFKIAFDNGINEAMYILGYYYYENYKDEKMKK